MNKFVDKGNAIRLTSANNFQQKTTSKAKQHSHKTVRSKVCGGGQLEGEGKSAQLRLVRMAAMAELLTLIKLSEARYAVAASLRAKGVYYG